MCAVSATFEYGRREIWPQLQAPPVWPTVLPNPFQQQIDLDRLEKLVAEFKELVEAAKKFDAATGQPDCEDPKKAALMRDIENRLQQMRAGK